jgi:hypothetical protein
VNRLYHELQGAALGATYRIDRNKVIVAHLSMVPYVFPSGLGMGVGVESRMGKRTRVNKKE